MIQDISNTTTRSSSMHRTSALGFKSSSVRFDRAVTRGLGLLVCGLFLQTATDCLFSESVGSYAGSSLFLSAQNPPIVIKKPEDPRPKRNVPPVTQRFFEEISKFTKIIDPEVEEGEEPDPEAEDTRDLAKAQELLDRLLSRRWLNDNERAQVHQSYAWLAQDTEQPRLAIEHLTKLLDYRESVRYALEERALDGLSKLHYSIEEFPGALKYALQFMDLALTVNANQCSYVAQIYLQLEDFENVKKWIRTAIDKKNELMRPVPEGWWQLLLYALTTLEHWDEALETLKVLVVEFPKREYWFGLAQAYMELGEDQNSTYTLEAAHTAGMFSKESDFLNLANRVVLQDAPRRAVWILRDGFEKEYVEPSSKTLKRYAQYMWIARDYEGAIEAYLGALEFEPDGKIWHRIAQLYSQTNDYRKCAEACGMALDSGDLDNPYNVMYQKGLCQFYESDFEGAKETFDELKGEIRTIDEEESLLRNVRLYLEAIDTEFRRIEHEQEVFDLERAYREEKAKAQS